VQVVQDDKRKKAIKKIVDKEQAKRAPVLRKVEADSGYVAGLQTKVADLEAQVADLNIRFQDGQ
jgi:hypothetical protein